MSNWQSAEEVLARNKLAMGDALGSRYTALTNEVLWLHWHWYEFTQLYANKPTRVALMNDTAPFFFSMVQRILWNDVLLGLGRLTEIPNPRYKANLTLWVLPPLIAAETLRTDVEERLETLRKDAAFVRDWRNRHVAHRDLALALGEGAKPLEGASKEKVDSCLREVAEILNAIDLHFLQSTNSYELGHSDRGAAELLYVLRDGIRRRSDADRMLECGEYRPDMLNDDMDDV